MDGAKLDLLMRYINCLISMRTNHSPEVAKADNRLRALLKSEATLSEIVQHTEALELALGIKPVMATNT